MKKYSNFYVNGEWVTPASDSMRDVINPATLEVCAQVPEAVEDDVNRAFASAKQALPSWSATSTSERSQLMHRIADEMQARAQDLIDAHVDTLGIPRHQAWEMQIEAPIEAMRYFADLCLTMDEAQHVDGMIVIKEPVGVCALINPWNYPLLQMIGKVAPALAAGCTMVEKPSEETPTSDFIMAEIFHKVGLPAGVFNLICGDGATIGPMMSSHPLADMVSFTGSSRAGVSVAECAAPSIKRVCQELGGKSALIITEDAPLQDAINYGVENVFLNAGQTCDALSRMLVPKSCYAECVELAREAASKHIAGDPNNASTTVGPLISMKQKAMIDGYLQLAENEGVDIIVGGTGMPDGVTTGAYVKPTIFGNVSPEMRIAREEIFGPVICMMPYEDIDQAIEIANGTEYGLSSAVWAKDHQSAVVIARQMQAGQCFIQGGYFRVDAPFGGYKQSGNGREWGEAGLAEYVETKAIIG